MIVDIKAMPLIECRFDRATSVSDAIDILLQYSAAHQGFRSELDICRLDLGDLDLPRQLGILLLLLHELYLLKLLKELIFRVIRKIPYSYSDMKLLTVNEVNDLFFARNKNAPTRGVYFFRF